MIGAALKLGWKVIPRVMRVLPKVIKPATRVVRRAVPKKVIAAAAKIGSRALNSVKLVPALIGSRLRKILGRFGNAIRKPAIAGPEPGMVQKGLRSRIWRGIKKVGSVALWFAPVPSVSTLKKIAKAPVTLVRKLANKIRRIKGGKVMAAAGMVKLAGSKVAGAVKKAGRRALKLIRKRPAVIGGVIGAGLLYKALSSRRNKKDTQPDTRDALNPEYHEEGSFDKLVGAIKKLISAPADAVKKVGEKVTEGAKALFVGLILLGLAFASGGRKR